MLSACLSVAVAAPPRHGVPAPPPCPHARSRGRRPEEVGDWWLPRRKGFNVAAWRAKCRCGHGHDEHDPGSRRCRCGCAGFASNFVCLVCDMKWEDHETVFLTTQVPD